MECLLNLHSYSVNSNCFYMHLLTGGTGTWHTVTLSLVLGESRQRCAHRATIMCCEFDTAQISIGIS